MKQSLGDPFGWGEKEDRQARLAVKQFVAAARTGDLTLIDEECLDDLNCSAYTRGGGWRNAMRGVARLPTVHPAMVDFFTALWYQYGEMLRSECACDVALTLGFRKLLLPYEGPSHLQLYRGESERDRRYRRIGLSWTVEIEVAAQHAARKHFHNGGGGVIISALVPASAIICGPLISDTCEQEYLVDRKCLRQVPIKIHERFKT